MAEQVEPVQRKVALKIIKAGMDTREVIVRFEAERQALALMDHPGIANILDAGATEAGRPYFVMELVNGIPITDVTSLTGWHIGLAHESDSGTGADTPFGGQIANRKTLPATNMTRHASWPPVRASRCTACDRESARPTLGRPDRPSMRRP